MIDNFIFNSSLLSNNRFSSIYDVQTCESSDDANKGTKSYHTIDEKKKKGHKEEM